MDKPLDHLSDDEKSASKKYFYASVLDASAPCLNEKKTKYTAVLKIADNTINPISSDPSKKKALIIYFFSKRRNAVPLVNEVGSIIRIHRATTQVHDGKLSLYCDVNNFGSCSIYKLKPESENDKYVPLSYSDSSYQFVKEDKERLDKIRKITMSNIKSLIQFELCNTIEDAQKKGFDSDFLALIMKKKGNKG